MEFHGIPPLRSCFRPALYCRDLPAAYEVNYLDAVAFEQFHTRPIGTSNDVEVLLDG